MSRQTLSASDRIAEQHLNSAKTWAHTQGRWWGTAILLHLLGVGLAGLLVGTVTVVTDFGDQPGIKLDTSPAIPHSPSKGTESNLPANQLTGTPNVHLAAGPEAEGGDPPEAKPGDAPKSPETPPEGFGGRGHSGREGYVGPGGTKGLERAVAGGLNWLARHQNKDGSWNLDGHTKHCKDASCTCEGENKSTAAATAFGLLPFLAAGQTHKSKGPYQGTIAKGIEWIGRTAKPDGNLQAGVSSMYAQGIATIVLCEAYHMSQDEKLKVPAQQAIEYICRAQHPELGGWHYYLPGGSPTAGDLSVTGWQLSALKSGQLAGLDIPPVAFEKAQKFMNSVAKGESGGLGSYMVETGPTPAMTAVAMLCRQYQGVSPNDPGMQEGQKYLLRNVPGEGARNSYYFFYAARVMKSLRGQEQEQWNIAMRKHMVDTQVIQGCAAGSWDPLGIHKDLWADHGGRLLITSMSLLSLETIYNFLPLYRDHKTDQKKIELDKPELKIK